jgi:D-glutamate cyclase
MLDKKSVTYKRVAQMIDDFMRLDYTGVGLIGHIYAALQDRQPGPVCMGAAELLVKAAQDAPGPVLIATGFPEGGGVPETDGPIGAALLARAIFLGLRRETVIVIDEDWEAMMTATLRGAGLAPMPFPSDGRITPLEFLRPVYIRTVPKDDRGTFAVCDELIKTTRPCAAIAIERPGCNAKGLYHGLGGRPLDGLVANLDRLFEDVKKAGIPFIGIGDGGNELGMGVIAEDLPRFSPKAADTGVPGRGGVAAVTAADWLVVSNISNWGATGIVAALSALLENPVVFHAPELEIRSTELCVAHGGVDGMFMAPEPAHDGIAIEEYAGMVRALRGSVMRALGLTVNWQGHQGDWRQVK